MAGKKKATKVTTVKKSVPQRKPVAKKSSKKTVTKTKKAEVRAAVVVAERESYSRNPRLWVGLAVVVLVVVAFFNKGLFIAGFVNGQPISRLSIISSLEKQSGKQALNNAVVETLIRQEAAKRHITVSQSEIDVQIKKIEDQLKGQGVTLNDALTARGLSRNDLVDQIKLQTMLNKMVGQQVKVTDDDVQAYIDKNQDTLPKDLSDEDLRKTVRTQLTEQQLQEKTQSFVTDLQKKAKVSLFVNY